MTATERSNLFLWLILRYVRETTGQKGITYKGIQDVLGYTQSGVISAVRSASNAGLVICDNSRRGRGQKAVVYLNDNVKFTL